MSAEADLLRRAVVQLRCEHSYPCQPPLGTLWQPGACSKCGAPHGREDVGEAFREPLAEWLGYWAGVPIAEYWPTPDDLKHARRIARVVLGEVDA